MLRNGALWILAAAMTGGFLLFMQSRIHESLPTGEASAPAREFEPHATPQQASLHPTERQSLAEDAENFVVPVVPAEPSGDLLDFSGCTHLVHSEHAYLECVERELSRFSTQEALEDALAAYFCNDSIGERSRFQILRGAARAEVTRNAFEMLSHIAAKCSSYRAEHLVSEFVSHLPEIDRDLLRRVRSEMTRHSLFAEDAGILRIRFCAALAKATQDPELAFMLKEAALGNSSAEVAQMDESLRAFVDSTIPPGIEWGQLIEEVMRDAIYPEDFTKSTSGGLMAELLLNKSYLEAAGQNQFVDTLTALCSHPKLGNSACAQIVRGHDRTPPPMGVDAETWAGLWDTAKTLLESVH